VEFDVAAAGGVAPAGAAAVEDKEESDDDMDFGLFDLAFPVSSVFVDFRMDHELSL
jgi:hypothetical protein